MPDIDYAKLARQHGGVAGPPETFAEQLQREAGEAATLGNAGKLLKAGWEKINPVEGIKGAYQAVTSPVETASGIWQAHKNLGNAAVEDWNRGDYIGALTKGIGAGVPLLGPEMVQNIENLNQGNTAEAFGGTAGTLLGLVSLPQRVSRLGSRWVGVPGMDALSPAQRAGVQMLEDRGVRLPAHITGGGDLPHAAASMSSVSPVGAVLAPRMARMTEQDLSRVAQELGTETHPQNFTPMSAGESVEASLMRRADVQERRAGSRYRPFNEAAQDPQYGVSVTQGFDAHGNPIVHDVVMPVDLQPFRATVQGLYEDLRGTTSSVRRHSSDAYAAMEDILTRLPRYIPAQRAEQILGALKADARTATGPNAGRMRFLVSQFQPAVDNAVRSADPAILRALEQGRGWTQQRSMTQKLQRQVTGVMGEQSDEMQLERVPEPVNVYRRLTEEGDTRNRLLERLDQMAPRELPVLGRAYVEDVLQTWRDTGETLPTQGVANKMWNDWHALGDEAKRKMYPNPMVRQNWDRFFEGVRQVGRNVNPSGTAKTSASLTQFAGVGTMAGGLASGSPLAALSGAVAAFGPSAVAGLMYTPRGAALLRTGLRIPAGDMAAAAAWTSAVGNLIEQTTDEEKIRKQLAGKPMLPYEYANPATDPRRR